MPAAFVATLSGCRRDGGSRAAPASSATSAAASGVAGGAIEPAASASASPAGAAGGEQGASGGGPARAERVWAVPLLDEEKGKRAGARYDALVARFCAPGGEKRGAQLGFDDAERETACLVGGKSRPIASGSFVEPGADEVLLEAASGRAWAGGERALALMRGDRAGYKFVKRMAAGDGFKALLQFGAASGRTLLMVCHEGGHMGLYQSVCGFLGEGSFRKAEYKPSWGVKNEFGLVSAMKCGEGASVRLGEIGVDGERLNVELTVEHFVGRKGKNPDEEGGDLCSRQAVEKKERFFVEYKFTGVGFRREGPLPRQVEEVLRRY